MITFSFTWSGKESKFCLDCAKTHIRTRQRGELICTYSDFSLLCLTASNHVLFLCAILKIRNAVITVMCCI